MKKKLIAGISVTMFLVTLITFGIPVKGQEFTDEIPIGFVGPKGWIQWDGIWEGAKMAADIINTAGGLKGPGGETYEIVPIDIDEHSVPVPDPAAAIAELTSKLDTHSDMQSIIGGFRTECVQPMREAAMTYAETHKRPFWTIAGAATDALIDCGQAAQCDWGCVRHNYERYKYMFRTTPLNSTVLFKTFTFGAIAQIVAPKLAALYGGSPVNTYIIAENLVWCDVMVSSIEYYGPMLTMLHAADPSVPQFSTNLKIVGKARPSPIETNFESFLEDAKAKDAQLVIHIFSAVAGANFIKDWGKRKDPFVCLGINVESQMHDFYEAVEGKCEYESFLASVGTKTNLNPAAKPLSTLAFWEEYSTRYDHAPIYTAWGTYDFLISLNETFYHPTINDGDPGGWYNYWQADDIDGWIRFTESSGAIDGFRGGSPIRTGLLGRFQFTGVGKDPAHPLCGIYHDPFVFPDAAAAPVWPSFGVRAHIPQWQASGTEGRLEVIFPQDQVFSRKYMIPPWMLPSGYESLAETDFAGGAPIDTIIEIDGSGNFYQYQSPDTKVDWSDLGAVIAYWFTEPPFCLLEADMANPYVASGEPAMDHFIDVFDVAKVASDFDKDY